MCKEAREYLAQADSKSPDEAREWLLSEVEKNPFFVSELRGMSIARAVLASLTDGSTPRPPILTTEPSETAAWHITRGFVDRMGIEKIDQLAKSPSILQLGAIVSFEHVRWSEELTNIEMNFYRSMELVLPAERIHIAVAPTSVAAA